MTTFVFRSTDAGAPALSGEVDKFIGVFRAIAVAGYNAHTSGLSIARTGSVATVTKTTHGYVNGQIIRNAAWDQAEYNVDAKISGVTANTYDYTVAGSPATPGTGTGTAKVCPLDWTETYDGTNKTVFRNRTASNQFYLRIRDDAAQSIEPRWYETMSDVDTGTGPCPTAAQIAVGSGPYMRKSSTSDATARAWKIWSNGKFVIVFIQYDGTSWHSHHFGDFTSYHGGDAYNTLIGAATLATETTSCDAAYVYTQLPAAHSGLFVVRSYIQTGAAVTAGRSHNHPSGTTSNVQWGSTATHTYPLPIGGGVGMSPILIYEGTSSLLGPRGVLPGLYVPWHNRPLTSGDTFSGVAGSALAGKTFEVANTGAGGQVFVETSDTWS
jgi:hypothetical protein